MDDGGKGCGRNSTWPVCSKPAGNPAQGLCDMAGNVSEWAEDCYGESYNGAPTDGSAWMIGDCSRRVLRGASWANIPQDARWAFRERFTAGDGLNSGGFRLARDLV